MGHLVSALASEPLPGANDVLTHVVVLPEPGPAWARRVGARQLWLFYRFDEFSVTVLGVNVHQPIPL